ncbi:MAG TPA: hydrogenase expression protein HypE [Chloroflexia bacterium]|nr:hydrogenase expression protein HypE [Chloroflexia bacterium]
MSEEVTTPPSPLIESDVEKRVGAVDYLSSSAERELRKDPGAERTGALLGPVKVVHAYWLAGMSCDGCTVAVTGATSPSVEDLLIGRIPGVPRVVLHHPVTSVESGEAFMRNYEIAAEGNLNAPYVVIFEGSVPNEALAAETGGYWCAMGSETVPKPIPTTTWLKRLAPGAAAVIAIGTCATWGGIPAAYGNPTGSMSVMDFLGEKYRSALGLPVVNVPGCSPVGDNFTETVGAVLLFLNGLGPLPEFDELGRPSWLFKQTVHQRCVRAGYYEEGTFADKYGGHECLVEIGCWGPVVQCNITERGAINHVGGCMNTGGVCIGCTMPGFPDRFAPFYKRPPGSFMSSGSSRVVGSFVRPLRRMTMQYQNREPLWDKNEHVPSGWGHVPEPGPIKQAAHYFYEKLQFLNSEKPGRTKPEEKYRDGYEAPGTRPGQSGAPPVTPGLRPQRPRPRRRK